MFCPYALYFRGIELWRTFLPGVKSVFYTAGVGWGASSGIQTTIRETNDVETTNQV
jgi:hypothetical protein